MKKYFTLIYSPGSNWKQGENWNKQDLMKHGNYMSELHKQGTLILGGPFDDGSGGQAVLAVNSLKEAEEIVKKDPAILENVFEVNIKPWVIAFESEN